MSKHTPGPWIAEHYRNGRREYTGSRVRGTGGADHVKVCDLLKEPGHVAKGEAEANARLIAAAPELLEALRNAERILGEHEQGHDPSYCLQSIRAAIAKAEGRDE